MAASQALAMGPALLRRFCSCDFTRVCSCGQPRPATRWTVDRLNRLRQLMREHGSLDVAARELDETSRDCNLALDVLIGRTPTHALAVLEARAERRT